MKLTTEEAEAWQRLCAKEDLANALLQRVNLRNTMQRVNPHNMTWQPPIIRVRIPTQAILQLALQKVLDDKAYFLDSIIRGAEQAAEKADGKQLCRLLFQQDGKVYARTQFLNPGLLEVQQEHLRQTPTGIRVDLGQGDELLVHAEAAGDRP